MTGRLKTREKEFPQRDGIRPPVFIGVASFEKDPRRAVAYVLDLKEHRRAAEMLHVLQTDLAHANRVSMMGHLAASIAHEINQPIGAARNNAHAALHFLAKDPSDLAEVREALECVVNDTYRASEILARIREQIKNAPPRKEVVALRDAIEDVISLVRGELFKQHVSIQIELADNLPQVCCDRVQLQQVILNLILNAVEAMVDVDDGIHELLIRSESTKADALCIAFIDSGRGLAADLHDQIFEAFYTTKAGGVGMGLSICRTIIEAHGGQLWVEANLPRGAVFRFTLPAHN